MTPEQAASLKVGDRVKLQRKGRPAPSFGTVTVVQPALQRLTIHWDSSMWNGEQDGDEDDRREFYTMGKIEVA